MQCPECPGPSTLWRNLVVDPRDPFGFEGYLSMMIGMNIPYRRTHTPTLQERQTWSRICLDIQANARRALTIGETLACIRAPGWQWPADLYPSE